MVKCCVNCVCTKLESIMRFFSLSPTRRGSPRALEEELRAKGSRLRTLIKAGGLWYPSVNTNTSANFRVDRKHNKVSLVSMFGPSPDWVVKELIENLQNFQGW
jgi:hypothetical protein